MISLRKYKSNICKNNIITRKTLLLKVIKLKYLIIVDAKKNL